MENTDKRLWQAVLAQAFTDAAGQTYFGYRQKDDDQRKARRWLLTDNKDFPLVCGMAGYAPQYVREKAKAMEARQWSIT